MRFNTEHECQTFVTGTNIIHCCKVRIFSFRLNRKLNHQHVTFSPRERSGALPCGAWFIRHHQRPSLSLMSQHGRLLRGITRRWQSSTAGRVKHVWLEGLLLRSHASLRAGPDPEGDAAAGDGGGSAADRGESDGAGRRGEEPGEPGREAAALQDHQAQREAQPRIILSARLLRGPRHPPGRPEPPAAGRGRGEAHHAEEGRQGSGQQLLRPQTVTECKEGVTGVDKVQQHHASDEWNPPLVYEQEWCSHPHVCTRLLNLRVVGNQ